MAAITQVATQFAEYYYSTFSADRPLLLTLYRDTSMLTFEGTETMGAAEIAKKLVNLPFQKTVHRIVTLDAQPFPGGILVMITGELKVDESEHAMKFSQTFSLMQEGASYFVHNDLFRLNYG